MEPAVMLTEIVEGGRTDAADATLVVDKAKGAFFVLILIFISS
jgi:hypothetical protein